MTISVGGPGHIPELGNRVLATDHTALKPLNRTGVPDGAEGTHEHAVCGDGQPVFTIITLTTLIILITP